MTLEEWYDKIDVESGYVYAFIDYGLSVDDITEVISDDIRDELREAIELLTNAVETLDAYNPNRGW